MQRCPGSKADVVIRHGKQGVLNTASNSQLENEFGTKNEDDVVKAILEKGDIQSSEVCDTLTYSHIPPHHLLQPHQHHIPRASPS